MRDFGAFCNIDQNHPESLLGMRMGSSSSPAHAQQKTKHGGEFPFVLHWVPVKTKKTTFGPSMKELKCP
jgi:hypothetical protein